MWLFHSILISFIKLKIRFGVKFGVNGVWLSQVFRVLINTFVINSILHFLSFNICVIFY